ncbi:hypothetical protein GCM10010982_21100 [Bowmanella pacifica]|uniref:Uncharacterized protein n=1 Tax=Bowmanella pacifica TaxID=502051 RepID=A0A917Z0J2_9ALTE|nr:hypothetical protein GCM10010982_21100 [Bowmanella pacifica]
MATDGQFALAKLTQVHIKQSALSTAKAHIPTTHCGEICKVMPAKNAQISRSDARTNPTNW